ncbi:hypothetical protein ONE63_007304 [Megalurothrips usitatus]|uniref:Uncharacterized protein n=1 Tax=Megalurothrips usitatus TaxID=439358 RepID=A0AAV7XRN2_9NEOP|nr:hypothetical protein ONE63_007304 [Megalurothrips usitatus]
MGENGTYFTWLDTVFQIPVWLYRWLEFMFVLSIAAVLGALSADVRRTCTSRRQEDCNISSQSSTYRSLDCSHGWAGIRVRQRIVQDLAAKATQVQTHNLLASVLFDTLDGTWALGEALSHAVRTGTWTDLFWASVYLGGSRMGAVVLICGVIGWRSTEVKRTREEIQRSLIHSESTPKTQNSPNGAIRQMRHMLWDVERQDGRCEMAGLFFLDKDTAMLILGVAATYTVVMFQFDVYATTKTPEALDHQCTYPNYSQTDEA